MGHLTRKHRDKLYLAAGVLAIWWSFSAIFNGTSITEFARLQRHMNSKIISSQTTSISSFDWSGVSFRYPPGSLTPLPTGNPSQTLPAVQKRFSSEGSPALKLRERRRREVRDTFVGDWGAYKKYAWMKDALKPLSMGYQDQFSGWAATLVDSLDTLWIMGLREEFDEAVDAVSEIDFGKSSSGRVNTFETNIRYLGGLMAAYDLSKRDVLLTKAVELGNLLYGAFNTENRMPVDFIDFEAAKTGDGLIVEGSVVSASPGTISLEFTRLSQLTGDPKYYDAISHVMDVFYEGQNKTQLPGLWPTMVSMSRKDVVSGNQFTLAGCADSLYEYLPKAYALLGGHERRYEIMSIGFMEAAKNLFFRPMIPGGEDILMPSSGSVDEDGNVYLDEETEHLACFLGGIYALGGKLFSNKEYVDIGSKLTLGCVYGYQSFPTGMMPERVNMVACDNLHTCEWDQKRFDKEKRKRPEYKEHLPLGFTTAKDPRYILRPETIESVFVMYRITGNQMWQDIGWKMFTAVSKGTETELGTHAAVEDVTRADIPLPQSDYMESFWLAETLKYFYLLFSPPDVISLDDYVLNTEAHPFLRS
ncbi:glycoside hydrolase family 47 protein [Annulohypoxylon maeteangense]|uniref:glycoside hydrolase family 47 protein n=1 Tax=Annulohypoxylon maeteangense TaxID=1927788 RepID=UPI0020077AFC|nr:glycoside hydrolase family 47 protein [Annulohypoxylon maeteangense]KAI0880262.1 glycoside hydrolase family 47 protein [Annulohypoxylon maeteangense]